MLFKTPKLDRKELEVLAEIEELRETLRHRVREPRRWTGRLRRVSFARAIRGSNSIEGYTVDLDDALAAAEGEEPLEAAEETRAAVKGYRDAMTYVLQLADDPHFEHSAELLRSLHYMMLSYDLSKSPGRWRPGPIFVEDERTGQIVYEGPEAELVPQLMRELIEELRAEPETPGMVRGAMAHLNLVMVHPFRDGNGRMARGLQTLVLAREGILAPEFSSIEEYLGKNTDAYYDILAEVGRGSWHPESDARPWIRFSLTAHYRQATTILRRAKEIERLWSLLDREISKRKLPDRVIYALYDAAVGFRVRNVTYRNTADITDWTASNDLKALVGEDLLEARGEARGRHYLAAQKLREIAGQAREPRMQIPDPFEDAA